MKKTKGIFSFVLSALVFATALVPAAAFMGLNDSYAAKKTGGAPAASPSTIEECRNMYAGQPDELANCGAGLVGDDNRDLVATVHSVVNAVFLVMGIVASIMIILAGVDYVLSRGDSTKTAKAKNTILYSVVGLVIALMAFAIVKFVLSFL